MVSILPHPNKIKKLEADEVIYSEYLGVGKVEQDIDPKEGGRVAFDGTTWPAFLADKEEIEVIKKGELVYVFQERRGLSLLVRRAKGNLTVCREHRRVR